MRGTGEAGSSPCAAPTWLPSSWDVSAGHPGQSGAEASERMGIQLNMEFVQKLHQPSGYEITGTHSLSDLGLIPKQVAPRPLAPHAAVTLAVRSGD